MKTYFKIMILCWALFAVGCAKDPSGVVPGNGEGVALYFTLPERPEVITRSVPADQSIDPQSVYVLLFDGSSDESVLLDWSVATAVSDYYVLKIADRTTPCYAYVAVNFLERMQAAEAGWEKGTTKLKNLKETLSTLKLPVSSGVITAMPNEHPMIGTCDLPGGISTSTTIGTPANPIVLTPMTVKITVKNNATSGAATFELLGASFFNAPDKGYLFDGVAQGKDTEINYLPYGKNGDIAQMMTGVETIDGVQQTLPLYGYESLAAKSSSVIIKARYNNNESYYRLNIFTADKTALQDLRRGYHYRIVIRAVQTAGYRTAAEAMSNPASNGILYDIDAKDAESYDIITNGVQYLGVTNSEYWCFNSNYVNQYYSYYDESDDITVATPFLATILNYTTSPTWSEGVITASPGIRFQNPDGTKSTTLTMPLQTGTAPVRKEIKIFMDNDFTEGQIDFRIGDLHKVVKVKRDLSFSVMGGVIPLGRNVTFASTKAFSMKKDGSTLYMADPTDFGLGYAVSGAEIPVDQYGRAVIDPARETYLRVYDKFSKSGWNYCHAEAYFQRNTSEGRVKIAFSREPAGAEPIGDYSYIPTPYLSGTFHRNNERGERLIQIAQAKMNPYYDRDSPTGFYWQARVLVGADFIRLGEWDESLVFNPVTQKYDGDPEARPVENGKTFISGDSCIVRLRLGLTDTNIGKKNRYGLVHILFVQHRNSFNKTDTYIFSEFLFVRQGEEADYLLTPGKTYTDPNGVAFTAPNVKFSPYELIDPTRGAGGPLLSDHTQVTSTVKPVFAPYPSMGGYLFQWSGDRMFHPINPQGDSSDSVSIANWDTQYNPTVFQERCPDGYMTPSAYYDGGIPVNRALQALGNYSGTNTIAHTAYLDGYLDRYIYLENGGGMAEAKQNAPGVFGPYPTSVGGTVLGALFYNPDTYASIYLPMLPSRAYYNGWLWTTDRRVMLRNSFWTRDLNSADATGKTVLAVNGDEMSPLAVGGSQKGTALRIRCVKDPAKP